MANRGKDPLSHIFGFTYANTKSSMPRVTVETFKPEIVEAMRMYDRYVICIDKTPDEFEASLFSLLTKALKAYETRGPQLRHGIALDKFVTIILSQSENSRPLCGIYFNLHSPYQKQSTPKPVKALPEKIGGPSKTEG
jgi:hypothetical protein